MPNASHGQFILLLQVTGDSERAIDSNAQEIHDAYMAEFGARGAFTILLLKLGDLVRAGTNVASPTAWNYLVRYFGPTDSVEWLNRRIMTVFERTGTRPVTQTLQVSDITGRY
jgi:hypothetical protein